MLTGSRFSEKLFRQNLFYKKKSLAVRAVEIALLAPFYTLIGLLLSGAGGLVASHLPEAVREYGAAVAGLVMFAAIGVSKHPEAYKVRWFGAAIFGASMLGLIGAGAMRLFA
jgi:hypothetical protein